MMFSSILFFFWVRIEVLGFEEFELLGEVIHLVNRIIISLKSYYVIANKQVWRQ